MSNTTMLDVAKYAGVSVATVSRVLNGSDLVSEATRQKVLKVCEELEYTLNPIAQSLRLGRTNSVAAILPFLTLPSIVERLRGVMASLSENSFELVPFTLGTPNDRDSKITELSHRSKTDGILIISMPVSDTQVDLLIRNKMPTVLIDSQHPKLDRINVDDRCGGKMVTDYLIGLGHRKIGFISSYLENPLQFSSTIYRFEGYRDALKEAGLPFNPNYQKEGEHGRDQAKQMALEMLSHEDPPTAIFTSSDTKAIGVLDAARELNLNVPGDLSVVGYDDIRDAEYMNLTTVRQPLFKAGRIGGRKLISLIEKPDTSPEEILLPLELIIRGTTAPPPYN